MRTLISDGFKCTAQRFGLWRIALGFYIFFYYLRLLPYSAEMYSSDNDMPSAYVSSLYSFFPESWLDHDSAFVVHILFGIVILGAVMIMLGWKRRIASLIMLYPVMWIYNRNPIGDSPEYEFINWLIFVLMLIPGGEAFAMDKEDPEWELPSIFYWSGWIILGLAYSVAGIKKYQSHDETWFGGTAMYYVLATDNARRAWYGDFFDRFPKWIFYPASWGGFYLEIFAPVFILFRWPRFWWWVLSTFTHLAILFFINIPQVSWGMILFHLFVFDEKWLDYLPKDKLDKFYSFCKKGLHS